MLFLSWKSSRSLVHVFFYRGKNIQQEEFCTWHDTNISFMSLFFFSSTARGKYTARRILYVTRHKNMFHFTTIFFRCAEKNIQQEEFCNVRSKKKITWRLTHYIFRNEFSQKVMHGKDVRNMSANSKIGIWCQKYLMLGFWCKILNFLHVQN